MIEDFYILLTPSPHHPITPSPHHPITPSDQKFPIVIRSLWLLTYFSGNL
ncbi:MAG: hypothetical protein F6J94_29485 [Moorea sp. SIO1F2]|nr:hypothetical protein [Moorena sp. SIO1F2]